MTTAKTYRKGPFVMIPESWIRRLHADGSMSTRAAVFMLLLSRSEFEDDDRCTAYRSREEMAASLDVSVEAVKKATNRLSSDGDIRVVKSGRKGMSTRYELMPSMRWSSSKGVPCGTTYHKAKGGTVSAPKGVPRSTPLYKETEGAGRLEAAPAQSDFNPMRDIFEANRLARGEASDG